MEILLKEMGNIRLLAIKSSFLTIFAKLDSTLTTYREIVLRRKT